MKTDAVYARQSVEKKDSLSIAGQIDLCRRTAGGGELRVYKDAPDIIGLKQNPTKRASL